MSASDWIESGVRPRCFHAGAKERDVLVGAGDDRAQPPSWTCLSADSGRKSGALAGWKPPSASFQSSVSMLSSLIDGEWEGDSSAHHLSAGAP